MIHRPSRYLRSFSSITHSSSSESLNITDPRFKAFKPFIDLSQEFIHSKKVGRPIIALESTILTHGLPSSRAVSLASELEQIALRLKVTPVHIALIEGRIKIGLSSDHLEQLLDSTPKKHVLKLGRRDLPSAISQKLTGGTTVSATMAIANLVGIKVFATGGIGGVHRGVFETMDISSDLTELAKTPVAVVCSGAKSILDIPLTLEYLETLGVPVISFSKTKDFPAFYTPKSGHQAPFHSSSALECAQMIYHSDLLELQSGTLIAVPIPSKSAKLGALSQKIVDQAVEESVNLGINKLGKQVTPWLLNRVKELSGGRSVDANIGLIKNNVQVASQIATHYNNLIISSPSTVDLASYPSDQAIKKHHVSRPENCRLMVIGAAAVDITSRVLLNDKSNPLATGSTSPGSVKLSLGGVASNIARTSHRLGVTDVMLVSQIGTECSLGDFLLKQLRSSGLRTDGLILNDSSSTGVVNMFLNDDGNLLGGVADMKCVEYLDSQFTQDLIRKQKPKVVCLDGNISPDTIHRVLHTCYEHGSIITAFEPTSVPKSTKILKSLARLFKTTEGKNRLSMMFPNLAELREIHEKGVLNSSIPELESLEYYRSIAGLEADEVFVEKIRRTAPDWVTQMGVLQISLKLLPFIECLVVKNGEHGCVLIASKSSLPPSSSSSTQTSNHQQVDLFPVFDSGKQDEGPNDWIFNHNRMLCFKYFPAVQTSGTSRSCGLDNNRPAQKDDVGGVHQAALVNVTGAGDSLCGSILSSLVLHGSNQNRHLAGFDWDATIDLAQRTAVATLKSDKSVGA